jgi:hypothetical protein
MADASSVAYAIGSPGGVTSSPKYHRMGFHSEPEVFVAGADGIDACLVGAVDEGVIVSFRGTLPLTFESRLKLVRSLRDFLLDVDVQQVEVAGVPGRVHRGFARALEDLWDPVAGAVRRQLGDGGRLFVTGHSKGAATATLAAIRLKTLEGIVPTAVYPFATTRIGDPEFARTYDAELPQTRRFVNRDDIIPHMPWSAKFVAEIGHLIPGFPDEVPHYEHTKTLQFIDWKGRIVDFGTLDPRAARAIERKRVGHMVFKLLTGIGDIARDHDIDGGYSTAVCG